MTYGHIEDLKFAVEVFDEGGNLIEVPARLRDLDAARAAYDACRTKYPKKLLYLCQDGTILRRSDRMIPKCEPSFRHNNSGGVSCRIKQFT